MGMGTTTTELHLQDEVRLVGLSTTWKRITSLSEHFVSLDALKPVSRRLLERHIAEGKVEHRSINALAAEQDAAIEAMRSAELAQDLTDHTPVEPDHDAGLHANQARTARAEAAMAERLRRPEPAPLAFGTMVRLLNGPAAYPRGRERGVVLWSRGSTMAEVAWERGGASYCYPHELEVIR
jgi:hypothetical protein